MKRQRKSGAGSRVKGGAGPSGAPGSPWQSGGRGGGRPSAAAPVLIETSDVTKTRLTARLNGAEAETSTHPVPPFAFTPPPPPPLVALTYFICFSQSGLGSAPCVKIIRIHVKPPFESSMAV